MCACCARGPLKRQEVILKKTVFWSWQSDWSERETRNLMREAIVMALDRLKTDRRIEERLEIDHDTRGLPGSPDIVASILEKIEDASVFIGDITPIAISNHGKHVANPNVMIELGYAKKALGAGGVITVWNIAFTNSRPEDLPFDLRGRRGPITYRLDAGASRKELAKARALLVDAFVDRIGGCLKHLQPVSPVQLPWQPSIDGDPSIWIAPGTPVRINEGWGSGTKTFVDGGRWYVRILPTEFESNVLDSGVHGPPVSGYGGFSWGQTKDGLMTYSGSVRADVPADLDAASMWFRQTGEVWAMQAGVGGEYRGQQVFYGDHIPEKWAEILATGLETLERNGARGPFHVRLGVTGLDGLHWPGVETFGGEPPVALEPAIEVEFTVTGKADWREGFVAAWTKLRRAFSMGKPDNTVVEKAIAKASR